MIRVGKAAIVYFLLVFAAGFALGVIREAWAIPLLGARAAETAEVPLMIGLSALAALWVARRFRLRRALGQRLAVGLLALALLVATELTVVLAIRGSSLERYLATRDPVALAAYLIGLLFFALMPALVRGGRHGTRSAS